MGVNDGCGNGAAPSPAAPTSASACDQRSVDGVDGVDGADDVDDVVRFVVGGGFLKLNRVWAPLLLFPDDEGKGNLVGACIVVAIAYSKDPGGGVALAVASRTLIVYSGE